MKRTDLYNEVTDRQKTRRLLRSYGRPYDHAAPFGDDNVGVYDWQRQFHNAGADNQERLLMAANRVGKTQTAAAEVAIHLTGLYPPWWQGKRFDAPVKGWIGSVTNESSKDIIQPALLGSQSEPGTGWIPKKNILKVTYRQAGVPEVVDTISVKHITGGISSVTLKTYEQGRTKWQGVQLDFVWLDEEGPMEIFTEAITRLLDKKGIMIMTFTPLLGPSDVVRHFMNASDGGGIYIKNVSWNDAPHLDEEAKARLKASYPEHERETRTSGTPMLGTGAIFTVPDEQISIDPIEIMPWWRRINGIDFGIDHPAAGAFCALDPEGDGTFYVYDCYRAANETPVYHAAAMKKHGDWIPTAWPHDGLIRDKGSGIALKDMYRKHGLRMLKEHAHYPDERGNHVEPGLIEMYEWMRTGRFKVFRTLSQWFEEKRMYHRKDGQVVKKNDDILSATRMAFIMRRTSRTKPQDGEIGSRAPTMPIIGKRRWQSAQR